MEYRRTENPAIPAEIMLGKYSTPVWIQSAWTEGEFAQYIRNNGCGHCCIAMAARLRGIDMDPYREYLLCRSLWGPPDAEKGQDHFLTVPGIEKILRHLGLSASCFGVAEGAQNQAADHIIRCLQAGKLVIFISDPFRYPGNVFSTGYHYVLAVGIRADGKILIGEFKYGECLSDPIYPNKSAGSNSGSNSSASSNKTSTIKNETSSTTQKTTAKKTTANAKVNAKPTEKVSSVKESSPAPEKKVSAPVKKDVKDLKIAYNCTYTGTTLNDKPNGKGKATYTGLSYVTYEGDFVDGKWHGKGKLTYKYDDYYEGDFVGGKFHGKGVRTFREDYSSNGFKRYEGDFVDGKMCGNGTLTYLSGDEYKGQFSNDKPHGKGVKTSPFGSIEDGTFENGDFVDGKIVVPEKEESKPATPPSPTISDADYLTYASSYFAPDYKPDTQPQKIDANSLKDGKYEGETLNGVPHGKGKLTFNDGGYYEGDFVNGLPHGKGKRVFKPKGIVTQYQSYEGNFANGKMNGKGTLYYTDGSYYVGAFSKDKPHGFGERYSTLGYKQRGKWEKGEFVSGDTLSTM